MKERPILFSAPMVLALLAGTKTQTRRLLKAKVYSGVEKFYFDRHPFAPSAMVGTPAEGMSLGPERKVWCAEDWCGNTIGVLGDSPYGVPGDRLWVKETWRPVFRTRNRVERIEYAADRKQEIRAIADNWKRPKAAKTGNVTPLFMPRWASRLTLEITDVRIERLQDISGIDAIAEGIERAPSTISTVSPGWRDYSEGSRFHSTSGPVSSYHSLWESINGAGSWAANPWTWAITFKKLETA